MSVNETYTKELKRELDYCAAWFPSVSIALGDVGYMNGYEFRRQGSLKDFGISFKSGKPSGRAAFEHTSRGGVSIDVKLAGQAPTLGWALQKDDAGIVFSFRRTAATLLRLQDCTITPIDDLLSLQKSILRLRDNGRWSEDLVIISEVVTAQSSTVLVANNSNSKLELRAAAKVAAPSLDLINVDGNFSVQHQSDMATNIVASGNLTPLFRAVAIKHRLMQPDVLRAMIEADQIVLQEVDYEYFDNKN